MPIVTKSIQLPAEKSDGLRICIMRRPGEYMDWDLWMPKLSPSSELLDSYKKNGLPWEKFKKKFAKEVLQQQTRLLAYLVMLARRTTVTLLCVEPEEEYCHRSLVKNVCEAVLNEIPNVNVTSAALIQRELNPCRRKII